jgi:hypothetical protein
MCETGSMLWMKHSRLCLGQTRPAAFTPFTGFEEIRRSSKNGTPDLELTFAIRQEHPGV